MVQAMQEISGSSEQISKIVKVLEAIDLRAAGQSVTPVSWVEPVFEEELSQRYPAEW
ncbi:MAG: hypothetical protein ACYTGH_15065 [Planctomycetota bacterium]|jgi:hypothetical protein